MHWFPSNENGKNKEEFASEKYLMVSRNLKNFTLFWLGDKTQHRMPCSWSRWQKCSRPDFTALPTDSGPNSIAWPFQHLHTHLAPHSPQGLIAACSPLCSCFKRGSHHPLNLQALPPDTLHPWLTPPPLHSFTKCNQYQLPHKTVSGFHEMTHSQNPRIFVENIEYRDFPGDSVVKSPCSQCKGLRFNPWSGN